MLFILVYRRSPPKIVLRTQVRSWGVDRRFSHNYCKSELTSWSQLQVLLLFTVLPIPIVFMLINLPLHWICAPRPKPSYLHLISNNYLSYFVLLSVPHKEAGMNTNEYFLTIGLSLLTSAMDLFPYKEVLLGVPEWLSFD